MWLVNHLRCCGFIYCLCSCQIIDNLLLGPPVFCRHRKKVMDVLSQFYTHIQPFVCNNTDVGRSVLGCQQLKHGICMHLLSWVSCFRVYLPEPLTGHISGISPKAQQRPVSQQHCILVYWPLSSAAQRPLARAEKQVPTRWSERGGDTWTEWEDWTSNKS